MWRQRYRNEYCSFHSEECASIGTLVVSSAAFSDLCWVKLRFKQNSRTWYRKEKWYIFCLFVSFGIGNTPCHTARLPIHIGQGGAGGGGRPLQVSGWKVSHTKEFNIQGLSWAATRKTSTSPHPSATILNVYIEAFTGLSRVYCPDGLNSTSLSQGCVLENSSLSGNSGQNIYSKDRGGSEEHLIAWVQVCDHPAFMSSHWLSPTQAYCNSSEFIAKELDSIVNSQKPYS